MRLRGKNLPPSIAPRPALGYRRSWTTRKRFGFQQGCFSVSTLPPFLFELLLGFVSVTNVYLFHSYFLFLLKNISLPSVVSPELEFGAPLAEFLPSLGWAGTGQGLPGLFFTRKCPIQTAAHTCSGDSPSPSLIWIPPLSPSCICKSHTMYSVTVTCLPMERCLIPGGAQGHCG